MKPIHPAHNFSKYGREVKYFLFFSANVMRNSLSLKALVSIVYIKCLSMFVDGLQIYLPVNASRMFVSVSYYASCKWNHLIMFVNACRWVEIISTCSLKCLFQTLFFHKNWTGHWAQTKKTGKSSSWKQQLAADPPKGYKPQGWWNTCTLNNNRASWRMWSRPKNSGRNSCSNDSCPQVKLYSINKTL